MPEDQKKPPEPQVSETGKRWRWMAAGLFGLMAASLVAGLAVVIHRSGNAHPTKASAASIPAPPPKTIQPSMPQDAHTQLDNMKRTDETEAKNNPQPAANGQPDPVAEEKRRRALAVALSPGGWVKGQDSARLDPPRAIAEVADADYDDVLHHLEVASRQPAMLQDKELRPPETPNSMTDKASSRYEYAQPDPDVVVMPDGTKGYVVKKGTIIEAVLENKLIGEFAGPVRCHTTTDVRGQDAGGKPHLIIPAGSILLGEASQVGSHNQRRLAVLFTDLQVQGWSVDLGKAVGLDQEGATALRDQVNRHLPETILKVGVIGALAGIAQSNSGTVYNGSGTERIYGGVGQSASEIGLSMLQSDMNRPPEITIRPGVVRVRVWVQKSFVVPEAR
jgi:type IV secretion system protein VirB10